MASVEQRGPTWIVRWREDGKQRKQAFATKEEADLARAVVEPNEKRARLHTSTVDLLIRAEILRLESELVRLRALLDVSRSSG